MVAILCGDTKGNFVIVGAGGFGRELASNLELILNTTGGRILGFIDSDPHALQQFEGQYAPILGRPSEFVPAPGTLLLMAISDPAEKLKVAAQLEQRGGVFGSYIHPTAIVVRTATLGRGCILARGTGVSANATVGNFVLLNGDSGVAHDASVGDGSTISSYVDICGRVSIGKEAFVGSHASILPGVRIGARARIGAGSIVTRNVPSGATVYAMPAKRLIGRG
jgi:sugar O-acyltransferase (sialic acid O-acetyltransferase NeuD family)